uniref:Cytochrome c oxidase subunit 3 n=1 Tax=Lutraria maxima TaxID=971267 RepID=A0A343S4N1_9BIVA|nr:cytochrome c oxidase subunit III [Lutraria maxima]AUH21197.1 cytochrome c oxidase subunit 3 [Lutraria maxima]
MESTYLGCHTSLVVRNLRVGMILFILSEVFFFVSFFWAFFNSMVGETSMGGVGCWPVLGVKAIFPWKVPALNTCILLSSGATVTWAHKAVKIHNHYPVWVKYHSKPLSLDLTSDQIKKVGYTMEKLSKGYPDLATDLKWFVDDYKDYYETRRLKGEKYRTESLVALGLTVVLGVIFTWLQFNEYYMASFSMGEGVYGSTFYLMTGFHGVHVIVGTIFLTVCWFRIYLYHFSFKHHYFGFDAAVWYWHFVDVVWIGLFFSVYVWGYY